MGYCSRRCSFTSPFLQKAAFWGPRPFGLLQSSLLLHVSFSPKSGFLGPRLFELLQSSLLLHASFSPKSGFFGGPGPLGYCSRRCSFTSPFLQKAAFWGPRLSELLQSSLLLHISFSPKSGFFGAPALWAIAVLTGKECQKLMFPFLLFQKWQRRKGALR